ncbi:hypothetical protein D3C75_1100120 [compost metagenome]
MTDIARAKISIDGSLRIHDTELSKRHFQRVKQCIQISPTTNRNIIDLISSFTIVHCSRKQICLHRILNKAEVTACLTIAIYINVFARYHSCSPLWDNCRICAGRVLALTEHIKIS